MMLPGGSSLAQQAKRLNQVGPYRPTRSLRDLRYSPSVSCYQPVDLVVATPGRLLYLPMRSLCHARYLPTRLLCHVRYCLCACYAMSDIAYALAVPSRVLLCRICCAVSGRLVELVKEGHVSLGDVRFVAADEVVLPTYYVEKYSIPMAPPIVVADEALVRTCYAKSGMVLGGRWPMYGTDSVCVAIKADTMASQ
eukprot:757038-Rhodomonas_salina.1